MRCPFCSNEDSQVKDSRPTEDNTAIRRRRVCEQCGSRFTTFERIQLRDLIVVKSDGQKESFDRDKMYRSLSNSGEGEIKTELVGQYIMEALSILDQVAYVRFASVYKNFREVKDFEDFLGNLEDK